MDTKGIKGDKRQVNMKEAIRHITEIEACGPVKAFYTTAAWNDWQCNEKADLKAYEELGRHFMITPSEIVRIPQTHTAEVRKIKKEDGGDGIIREAKEGYDGMITDEKGILLCTVEADCVPVYLYDPVKNVIGMVHSGWRGCAGKIAEHAVEGMQDRYGCRPEDIVAALGPCICGACYEVGEELIDGFAGNFSEITSVIFKPKENGKYLLDLPAAIRYSLIRAGLTEGKIFADPVCTFESGDLCSWRRDHDPAARMLTGIMLSE